MAYRKYLLFLLLISALNTNNVHAQTASTTIAVSATVLTDCAVIALPLVFGNYSSGSNNDATSTITVTCTIGTPYNIGLDAGGGAGATVTTRKLTSGSDTLDYILYQDASRTIIWGETIGADTISIASAGAIDAHTIYGRSPSGQNVPAGAYTDTVTVTVSY